METIIRPHYHILARLGLLIILPTILVLALMPVSQAPLPNWNDKIQHILAFATITLLIDAAWPTMPLNYQKILAIISYGFLIEILQSFTEDRSASFADIVADAGGIFLYWLSIPFLQKLPVLKIRWHFSQDRLC